jgi:hydroxypyruvate reductase
VPVTVSDVRQARALLASLFSEALQVVHGRRCVAQHLQSCHTPGDTAVIAIGKAACAMLNGALEVLQDAITSALVISPVAGADSCPRDDSRIRQVCGNHPLPAADSLAAGQSLQVFIEQLPARCRLLFLISGGTSSLVEIPLPGISLADLQAVYRWLLGSGLDIAQVNRVRSALSQIKGGKLRGLLGHRETRALLLSDVPGDDPGVIGSGLLQPPSTPAVDLPGLPDWLQAMVDRAPAAPGGGQVIEHDIVGSNRVALEAIVAAARSRGWQARSMDEVLSGDVQQAAGRIVAHLHSATPGLYVWGGETTVRLPGHPGEGGRNQHLALTVARQLAAGLPVVLLAAGSDGRDGNSEAAGAIVDAHTVSRGQRHGLDAADCLQRAAAGTFLRASGDRLVTGPTGTNVMDIVIAVKLPESGNDARSV